MRDDQMSARARDSLEQYVERGTVRGPDAVLEAATEEEPVYVDAELRHPGRRWVAPSVAAAVIAVGVLTLVAAMSGDGGDSTDTAAAPATSTTISQKVLDEATDRLMEQRAAGWIPVSPSPGVPGIELPASTWMRAGDGVAPLEYDPVLYRVPVYDEMDGVVIGYDYQKLGYVPLNIADSGDFDAAQARVDKYGCDLLADANCRLQLAEERAGRGD